MTVRRQSGDHEPDDELLHDDEVAASILGYDASAMRQDQGGRPPVTGSENRHMVRLRKVLQARTRRIVARQSRGDAVQPF
ncbi:hypothetical protein E1293_38145 [Actinomadura darangshiensis]|uniref:Uncharacterized protein n=1 Tax=Actinomadura darangshiensis TaxID=705336 RepID=A0A4R5A8A9_9ACTN|nr:hypothetical protein [Actinomadura darangshiensis]TDD67360.1 hypothetical protein E1293_38145 [Actinomadura darangshiensis]